jgi:hypothetical protein
MDRADDKRARASSARRYRSFTSAMTIPATTNTTTPICIQIQVGDTAAEPTCRAA